MVRYKGYTDTESNEMDRIFNSGTGAEVDGLLAKLKGQTLEVDKSVPPYSGPLFHGTTNPKVAEQGRVAPARSFGGKSYNQAPDGAKQQPGDYAFATEREGTAWSYAVGTGQQTGGRAYVVPVKPNLQMEKGDHYDRNHEWRSGQFETGERIDTMPGRQGTIPTENWNKYRGKSASTWDDANHPSDRDVERSTRGGLINAHALDPDTGLNRDHRSQFEDSVYSSHSPNQTKLF